MLYLVYLEDIADNMPIRKPLLNAHMAHMGTHAEAIRLGGPIMRDDGSAPAGGVLLIEAQSKQEVIDIIDADPYKQAGLWPQIRIHAFKDLINTWKNPT
ncbi:MAG: YciI family protein [Gammaproteobacteria bacterium]|nr:YciI family protein [Gammaproteobacteria bacterium]MCP5140537.1 YciI family protein [Chromatiales bacterium]